MKRWPMGRRPGLLLAALVAAAAVLAWGSERTLARMDTAEGCTGACHVDLDPRHLETHPANGCGACHETTLGEKVTLLVGRVLSLPSSAHAPVNSAVCANCHNDDDYAWVEVAATEGHAPHRNAAGVQCLSCHKNARKSEAPRASICLECHKKAPLHERQGVMGASGDPECLECHNFRRAKPDRKLLSKDLCANCHGAHPARSSLAAQAPRIEPSALHGGVDCRLCHEPHGDSSRRVACSECHQIELGHAPGFPEEHRVCTACHEQHAPLETADRRCGECHEQAAARSEDSTTALRHDSCSSCHEPHDWVAVPNGCVQCHQRQNSLVFGVGPSEHQRCTGCHEVHGPNATGAICATCHEGKAIGLRRAPERHQDCVSCHQPHSASVDRSKPCAQCHSGQLHQVLSSGLGAHANNGCAGCHSPHDDPSAGAKPCANCHRSEHSASRKGPEQHQICSSCHKPHRFSIGKELPCAQCHQTVTTAASIHRDTCTKCHAPHGSPEVSKKACQSCHESVHLKPPPRAPEHGRCASCHEPHKKSDAALARCATCHESQATVAASWPKNSPHQSNCTGCHQPHAVRTIENCGKCHAKQSSEATSTHQCTTCHAPHQKPAATVAGWWAGCANCHASEAQHSKRHADCNQCHKPHGFTPPNCTSCHTKIQTQAAHRLEEHRDCTKCHDAHEASLPGRAQCLACHTDKVNHQPNASSCYGCHPFK